MHTHIRILSMLTPRYIGACALPPTENGDAEPQVLLAPSQAAAFVFTSSSH